MRIILFGRVDFVKSVISIILVALLGHKNDPITESSDLGVQRAKSCVSWIQTTYQKMGGCTFLLAELSMIIDDSKSQLALEEAKSWKKWQIYTWKVILFE